MTRNQHNVIARIESQHEAERFIAAQAARDVSELDARAVLVAVEVKMNEGNIDAARALVAQWRASQKGS